MIILFFAILLYSVYGDEDSACISSINENHKFTKDLNCENKNLSIDTGKRFIQITCNNYNVTYGTLSISGTGVLNLYGNCIFNNIVFSDGSKAIIRYYPNISLSFSLSYGNNYFPVIYDIKNPSIFIKAKYNVTVNSISFVINN